MQGPITSWRRAIEQDGPGGAGKRRGADIADAPREPRAVRRDAGQRRVFLDPHVTHADRARGRPAGFELLGLVVAGRLNAEVVVAEALAEALWRSEPRRSRHQGRFGGSADRNRRHKNRVIEKDHCWRARFSDRCHPRRADLACQNRRKVTSQFARELATATVPSLHGHLPQGEFQSGNEPHRK
jgi:hypothetical protein